MLYGFTSIKSFDWWSTSLNCCQGSLSGAMDCISYGLVVDEAVYEGQLRSKGFASVKLEVNTECRFVSSKPDSQKHTNICRSYLFKTVFLCLLAWTFCELYSLWLFHFARSHFLPRFIAKIGLLWRDFQTRQLRGGGHYMYLEVSIIRQVQWTWWKTQWNSI